MRNDGDLRCPSCGASVSEGARRCAHCDALIATVRCANCFHMTVPEAAHCSGCGRDLGLEPIPRGDALECAACRAPMSAFDCGPGALHDCGRCGAQFVEHAALRFMLERHDELEIPVARPPPVAWQTGISVRYLPCPVCHAMMNRKSFGAGSGVIVDVCSKHGTWFDAGELPRVLAFVESGGLARVRRRNAEEAERLARERAALAAVHALHGADALPFAQDSTILDFLHDLFGS